MTVPPIFDQVAATMYMSEVHDLTDACLFQLQQLERASVRWAELGEVVARRRVRADARVRDREAREVIHSAMMAKARVQSEIFDGVEAFLAAWARLSLIFKPGDRRSSPYRDFTVMRGNTLRRLYGLEGRHPLLVRSARDNWMHSDERLDQAWMEARLGNRQSFVKSGRVKAALCQSVRVIDVEALTIYTRDEFGEICALSLRVLGGALKDIEARREMAYERVAELPLIDRKRTAD